MPPCRATSPTDFLWGTATAAHQIEGGNVNNDWWAFEHDPTSGCVDVSGDACDSFNRFPEDIALVAGLGFSSYRFSLEWSRIEPEEGEFSRSPSTTTAGWPRPATSTASLRWSPSTTSPTRVGSPPREPGRHCTPRTVSPGFCERAAAHLGDLIGMACTLNEPNVVATMGWRHGIFPPRVRDRVRRRRSTRR